MILRQYVFCALLTCTPALQSFGGPLGQMPDQNLDIPNIPALQSFGGPNGQMPGRNLDIPNIPAFQSFGGPYGQMLGEGFNRKSITPKMPANVDIEGSQYLLRRYDDHICQDENSTEIWKMTGEMFEVVHQSGMKWYREFTCKNETQNGYMTVQLIDYESNDRSSKVYANRAVMHSWWTALVEGKCAPMRFGSFRFDRALPKGAYDNLKPCSKTEHEYATTVYFDKFCRSKFHFIVETLRRPNPKGSDFSEMCIDVTNNIGQRYNNDFKCENHAIVQKTYMGEEDGRYGCKGEQTHHEFVWSFQRWEKYYKGECVDFWGKFALKIEKTSVFEKSLFSREIEDMKATECGNPMGYIHRYQDKHCLYLLSTQDLIHRDTGQECVKVVDYHHRGSTKHCANQSHVELMSFATGDCTMQVISSYAINTPDYKPMLEGACKEVKSWMGETFYMKGENYNAAREPIPDLRCL